MAITNPGSALGEAVGALLEARIHEIIGPIAKKCECIYITAGPKNTKTGKNTKLILTDADGNDYNIDSLIVNERLQPLVLVESKYIRYKKHNRDKASWVCTAHTKLRQKYATVRRSITILMGNWSAPSQQLLKSFEVETFLVDFEQITAVLKEYGVVFDWDEKDREQASASWEKFNTLSDTQKSEIAVRLLSTIEKHLAESLELALKLSEPREIKEINLFIKTNYGETFIRKFENIEQIIAYFDKFDENVALDTKNAPAIVKSE